MSLRHTWRPAILVAVGLLVGLVLGPPVASAVSSAVKIEDRDSTTRADVDSNHRLHVDTEATASSGFLNTFAITEPSGETVLISSSSDQSLATGTNYSDIVGASVDVRDPGTAAVTVQIRKGLTTGSGEILWQGTVPTGVGHIDWDFGQSLAFLPGTGSGFNVHVINPGGATVQYEVYGAGFGVSFSKQARLAAAGG